jgi:hypothetical protein
LRLLADEDVLRQLAVPLDAQARRVSEGPGHLLVAA